MRREVVLVVEKAKLKTKKGWQELTWLASVKVWLDLSPMGDFITVA